LFPAARESFSLDGFRSEALASVRFAALGSVATVAVADGSVLEPARAVVEARIAEFDLACSRFRPDSELSAVNAAAGSAVSVGPLLLEAVAAALKAAQVTDGDVDPTVGEAVIALGYDSDFDEIVDSSDRRFSIVKVPGWQGVSLDAASGTIRVPRGVSLDLGATAKALAADQAATRAHSAVGCGVLVSLGGDLAIAGQAPHGGWTIRVTDDHRASVAEPGQWIALSRGGLATSSTSVRRWLAGSRTVHHLIDPSTGRPADGPWRTVSITAATCLEANVASTAAIVRGAQAVAWLEAKRLPSRLVSADGRVVHLAGWPSEGDDLPSGPRSMSGMVV
jgi:thiamine biosynthesis lipoprotein